MDFYSVFTANQTIVKFEPKFGAFYNILNARFLNYMEVFKGFLYSVVRLHDDSNQVWRFDPSSLQWIHLTEFDGKIHSEGTFQVLKDEFNQDDKIYFGGGEKETDSYYWDGESVTNGPTVSDLGCLRGKGFLDNGKSTIVVGGCVVGCCESTDVYKVDHVNQQMTLLGSLKTKRQHPAVLNLGNGKVLVTAGINVDLTDSSSNTMELYDPVSNSWTWLTQTSPDRPDGLWSFIRINGEPYYVTRKGIWGFNPNNFEFTSSRLIDFPVRATNLFPIVLPNNYFL